MAKQLYVVRLEMRERGVTIVRHLLPRTHAAAISAAADGNFYHQNINHTVEKYDKKELYVWAAKSATQNTLTLEHAKEGLETTTKAGDGA